MCALCPEALVHSEAHTPKASELRPLLPEELGTPCAERRVALFPHAAPTPRGSAQRGRLRHRSLFPWLRDFVWRVTFQAGRYKMS